MLQGCHLFDFFNKTNEKEQKITKWAPQTKEI